MTLDEAKSLTYRQTIYSRLFKNADKTPARFRVNGRVRLWKRSPHKVYVPLKYGLDGYDFINELNLDKYSLKEDLS